MPFGELTKLSSANSEFDVLLLWQAMDAKRRALGYSESEMMEDLNRVNNQRVPMALDTVKNMVRRRDTTCQHALHMLRWLNKTPESFLTNAEEQNSLPFSSAKRLYWSMAALGKAVAEKKTQERLAWKQVADELGCTQSQASGIAKLRYGMSVHLAMRITQWLGSSSADFIREID